MADASRQDRFKAWLGDGLTNNTAGPAGMAMWDPILKPILDFDSSGAFVGTCTVIEKDYFRTESVPDPNHVRPLPILKKALENAMAKYRSGEKNYVWFGSQCKAMRQDCVLQHINNEFTINLYETNSYIALYNDDYFELAPCLTQLSHLYRHYTTHWYSQPQHYRDSQAAQLHPDVVCKSKEEFLTYRLLLTLVSSKNDHSSTQHIVMHSLTSAELRLCGIRYGLELQRLMDTHNSKAFFSLYHTAPYLTNYILKDILLNFRRRSLHMMLHSSRPSMDFVTFAIQLGFIPPHWLEYNTLVAENSRFEKSRAMMDSGDFDDDNDDDDDDCKPEPVYSFPQTSLFKQCQSRAFTRQERLKKLLITDVDGEAERYDEITMENVELAMKNLVEFLQEHNIPETSYTLPEFASLSPSLPSQGKGEEEQKSKKRNKKGKGHQTTTSSSSSTTTTDTNNNLESLRIPTPTGPIGWLGRDHSISIKTSGTISMEVALGAFLEWQTEHNAKIRTNTTKQLTQLAQSKGSTTTTPAATKAQSAGSKLKIEKKSQKAKKAEAREREMEEKELTKSTGPSGPVKRGSDPYGGYGDSDTDANDDFRGKKQRGNNDYYSNSNNNANGNELVSLDGGSWGGIPIHNLNSKNGYATLSNNNMNHNHTSYPPQSNNQFYQQAPHPPQQQVYPNPNGNGYFPLPQNQPTNNYYPPPHQNPNYPQQQHLPPPPGYPNPSANFYYPPPNHLNQQQQQPLFQNNTAESGNNPRPQYGQLSQIPPPPPQQQQPPPFQSKATFDFDSYIDPLHQPTHQSFSATLPLPPPPSTVGGPPQALYGGDFRATTHTSYDVFPTQPPKPPQPQPNPIQGGGGPPLGLFNIAAPPMPPPLPTGPYISPTQANYIPTNFPQPPPLQYPQPPFPGPFFQPPPPPPQQQQYYTTTALPSSNFQNQQAHLQQNQQQGHVNSGWDGWTSH